MESKMERRGLGRGLSALMADVSPDQVTRKPEAQSGQRMLPVEKLFPNPDQPRQNFDPDSLAELAESIREKGIIQPLIVRADPNTPGQFQIVAGERRWRAAQIAQLHEVPVIERGYSDAEVLEIAIIENLQRSDLSAVEEARAYDQLMGRFGHTQEKVAEALGKSRSHIANMLRLLTLPKAVQDHLQSGALSMGHARALIPLPNPAEVAAQVISKGLSVRATEDLVRKLTSGEKSVEGRRAEGRPSAPQKDADTRALEQDLSASLRMAVSIDHRAGADTGSLSISFSSLDELDLLCALLTSQRRDMDV
jgi:ParB family transcriptional regulator, chromosome partitioning protein